MKLEEITQVCDISTLSVHIITSQKLPEVLKNKRASRGRKRKLSLRQERLILCSIPVLREREGSFTLKRLLQYNRICGISDRTIRRLLNRNGYHYLQARKKGLVSASDRMKRVAFARRIINNCPPDVWTNKIAYRSYTNLIQWIRPALLEAGFVGKHAKDLNKVV